MWIWKQQVFSMVYVMWERASFPYGIYDIYEQYMITNPKCTGKEPLYWSILSFFRVFSCALVCSTSCLAMVLRDFSPPFFLIREMYTTKGGELIVQKVRKDSSWYCWNNMSLNPRFSSYLLHILGKTAFPKFQFTSSTSDTSQKNSVYQN